MLTNTFIPLRTIRTCLARLTRRRDRSPPRRVRPDCRAIGLPRQATSPIRAGWRICGQPSLPARTPARRSFRARGCRTARARRRRWRSRQVAGRGLPLRAGEGLLDRRHVIEMQDGDQMDVGRPGGRHDAPLAHLVFAKAGNRLQAARVFKIMLVERCGILRRLVQHYQPSHRIPPSPLRPLQPPYRRSRHRATGGARPRNATFSEL